MKQRSIPSLTGIRGVAAVWVFLTHFQAVLAAYLDRPEINANSFLYNGFRGVDLFFVLSGFILMHVHSDDFVRITQRRTADFYILRFFRVYPLNTVVLLALLPIPLAFPDLVDWFRAIPFGEHDFSGAGFVQTLFLAQTWTVLKLGAWNGPAWTLSAEVFGYALFPLLAHVLMRQRSALLCMIAAASSLATLIFLLVLFGHAHDNPTGSFGLIRMMFSFVAGMSLSRCYRLLPPAMEMGTPVTLGSLAFIALALSVSDANLLVVAGFGGLIFGLAFQQGPLNALLTSRPAMFLGRISFPLYLIHFVPLKIALWLRGTAFAQTSLGFRKCFLLGLVGFCVMTALAAHVLVELPCQRFARHILHGTSPFARLITTTR